MVRNPPAPIDKAQRSWTGIQIPGPNSHSHPDFFVTDFFVSILPCRFLFQAVFFLLQALRYSKDFFCANSGCGHVGLCRDTLGNEIQAGDHILGTVPTGLSQDRACAQRAASQRHACMVQAGRVYRASQCNNIYSRPGHAYFGVLGLTSVWPQARRPIYRHTVQSVC